MKRYSLFLFVTCLICFSLICLICRNSFAQDNAPLYPPPWTIGDSWIVESQTYNLGKIVSRPSPVGWSPRVAWRFQVEKSDSIEGQDYFVVTVRPFQNNQCPYWFKFWFRVSDRQVGRYEMYHPENPGNKTRSIGPPFVRKDYPPTDTIPFFTSNFPTLPLTVPLFSAESPAIPSELRHQKFNINQAVQEIDGLAFEEKADEKIRSRIEPVSRLGNKLITLTTESNIQERQYWNNKLPWAFYGERHEKTSISRRYWLVEIGKE